MRTEAQKETRRLGRARENLLARQRWEENREENRKRSRSKFAIYRPVSPAILERRELLAAGKKKCGSCHEIKELDKFHRNKNGAGGRGWTCASCARATHATRPSADPALKHDRHIARWERDPVACRMLSRANAARRRARLQGSFVEHVDPQIVWERGEGICGICNVAADYADWHLDHVIPISKGGPHSYANTQVSHPKCNLKKGDRL